MNVRAKWMTASLLGVLTSGTALWAQAPAPMPPAAAAAAPKADVVYKTQPLLNTVWSNGRPTDATQKLEKGTVLPVIRGDQQYAANEAKFKAYYTRYLFPLMTQTSPEQLANLPKIRALLFRDHFRRNASAGSKDVYPILLDLTFTSMKELVQDNYHPAVRYNAMLIIGELNTKEAVIGGGANAAPAEPLAEARNFMLKELINPEQSDGVKMAALLGLQRHAEIDAGRPAARQWTAADRAAIVKQLIPLATDKTVPANRTPEGHAWLRGRVVDVLATMSQAQPDEAVSQLLLQLVSDDKEPLSLRLVAADGIAKQNLANSPTLKGNEVGRKLADLLIAASRKQLTKLSDEIAAEKARRRREAGGGLPLPLPQMTQNTNKSDPVYLRQEQRLALVRRTLKDEAARVGNSIKNTNDTLGAMSAAKAAPQKDYLTKVFDAIGKLSKVADIEPEPDIYTLEKEMKLKIDDLERIAKTSGGPAAAPVPAGPGVPETPEGPGELPTSPVSVPDVPAGGAKK